MLVYVRWRDAVQPIPEWTSCKDVQPGLMECESIGWLIAQSDLAIVLAGNIADYGSESFQCSGYAQIPKSAIISWSELEPRALIMGSDFQVKT